MENNHLLPEEQKGSRRKSRGMKDQSLIDKRILKIVGKEKQILLWRGWTIERPMILSHIAGIQSTLKCLALLIILEKSMKKCKLRLTSTGSDLREIDVKRGIFQGDSCRH